MELPSGADREAKLGLLEAFCARVRDELAAISLDTEAHPWVRRVRSFYREASP